MTVQTKNKARSKERMEKYMKKRLAVLGTGMVTGAICMVMAMTVFAAGITEDRAKEIALENAKVSQEDVSFIWTEVDYDHGRKIYDVEFFTKDYKEYDYEIDAENGTILEMDYDAEYELRDRREDRSRREGSAQTDDLITAEEAKAAALKQVGLEDSQVRWGRIEKDYDDGRILYDGKFFYNEMEYEFEVDGRDGRVVEWDVESIYD